MYYPSTSIYLSLFIANLFELWLMDDHHFHYTQKYFTNLNLNKIITWESGQRRSDIHVPTERKESGGSRRLWLKVRDSPELKLQSSAQTISYWLRREARRSWDRESSSSTPASEGTRRSRPKEETTVLVVARETPDSVQWRNRLGARSISTRMYSRRNTLPARPLRSLRCTHNRPRRQRRPKKMGDS